MLQREVEEEKILGMRFDDFSKIMLTGFMIVFCWAWVPFYCIGKIALWVMKKISSPLG